MTPSRSHAATPEQPELARYSRQMLFDHVGVDGQRRLRLANVTLVGCGALGSVLANTLVRAGVGSLRIIDRDFIEINNLQRQVLFDEHDISRNLPKAEAATRKLRKINSAVEVEPVVADMNPGNVARLCGDADLILDGTDNLETRYLINDLAVREEIPWVYGACIGAEGMVLPILPHRTPCLRCVWEDPPSPGVTPTCDTVGVLATAVNVVASLQATEALKILMGREDELNRNLSAIDVWSGRIRSISVRAALDEGSCPCCKHGHYEFLSGTRISTTMTLCGRNAVQILPPADTRVSFRDVTSRLPPQANPKSSDYLLRFGIETYEIALFPDGRAIVQGTDDAATARGVYAKYVGL